jgi:hypothetical protein
VTQQLAPEPFDPTDQDGVLTTAQAIAIFDRGRVRAQLAAERWRRPTRGVIVLHNGPLTPTQQRWVAILRCPPGTVLGGLTALAYDGFTTIVSNLRSSFYPTGVGRRMTSRQSFTGRASSAAPTYIHFADRRGPGRHEASSTPRAGHHDGPSDEPGRSSWPASNSDSSALVISAKR